jgi:hypothetical protein
MVAKISLAVGLFPLYYLFAWLVLWTFSHVLLPSPDSYSYFLHAIDMVHALVDGDPANALANFDMMQAASFGLAAIATGLMLRWLPLSSKGSGRSQFIRYD